MTNKIGSPFSLEKWKAGKGPVMYQGAEVKHLRYEESVNPARALCGYVGGAWRTWAVDSEQLYFKAPWYENIPEQGILCRVDGSYKIITAKIPYSDHVVFLDTDNRSYSNAVPATLKEINKYILEEIQKI